MHKYYQRQSQYTQTGKVALCCIGKMENDYIREYVKYYEDLHFDKIFVYDNNDENGERFEDVIGDFVEKGFVEIVDFRGRKMCQCDAYQDCYDKHNKEYDWIAFYDCDEFLTFVEGTSDVHDFLCQKQFLPYQLIHINWMVYGDNDMLDNDGRNVVERFENPVLPLDFKTFHQYPENYHIKSFVRGGFDDIRWGKGHGASHTPLARYYACCDARALPCECNSPFLKYDYSVAYIRHYSTKSIGEWVKMKVHRGYPDQTTERQRKTLALDVFFMTNKKTKEKMAYAERCLQDKQGK